MVHLSNGIQNDRTRLNPHFFGSEFVALKIATEMKDAMRCKLRMLGIPILEPTNTFFDNSSVVINVTKPELTLQKK